MRYKQFLLERRMKSNRNIMFHGTSSKFLKSIKNNGLKAEPKKKVWKDDPNASFILPSRASLKGTYLTSNYGIASSSALNSTLKFGGNNLIVCALIQQRSALPDEDKVKSYIRDGFVSVLEKYNGQKVIVSESGVVGLYVYIKNNPKILNEFAEIFRQSVIKRGSLNKKSIPIDKAKKMLMATIERKLVYVSSDDSWGGWSSAKYEYPKIFEKRPTNKNKAERNYSKATDEFSKSIKPIAIETGDIWGHTLRVTEDVKFNGRNKIICILEIIDDDIGYSSKIKIHYGKPPKEFEDGYRNHMGGELKYL